MPPNERCSFVQEHCGSDSRIPYQEWYYCKAAPAGFAAQAAYMVCSAPACTAMCHTVYMSCYDDQSPVVHASALCALCSTARAHRVFPPSPTPPLAARACGVQAVLLCVLPLLFTLLGDTAEMYFSPIMTHVSQSIPKLRPRFAGGEHTPRAKAPAAHARVPACVLRHHHGHVHGQAGLTWRTCPNPSTKNVHAHAHA